MSEPETGHFGPLPAGIPGLRVRHTPTRELPPGWTFEAIELPSVERPGRTYVRYTVKFRDMPVMMVVMEDW
jgi:hypothetical protein